MKPGNNDKSQLRAMLFLLSMPLLLAWSEPDAPYRRSVELNLEPTRIRGDETAMVELLVPGLLDQQNGSDLRIESDEGDPVAMRVIKNTTDDRAAILFNPIRGKQKYFAYWGGKTEGKQPPAEPKQAAGLLAEMKRIAAGPFDSHEQLERLWDKSGDVQSRAMFDRLFLGFNPTLVSYPTIGKITGTLYVPIDGEYQFALSADDRGGLKLDGKELLFARGAVANAKFNTTISLKRGPHKLEYFHVDTGGDWLVSLVWKRPDSQQFDPLIADNFGRVVWCKTGRLEEKNKPLTADLNINWQGETIIGSQSSYRLRFDAPSSDKRETAITWDFGDGQTATGSSVYHVFLAGGKFAITCKIAAGKISDSKTFNQQIGRDPNRMIDPALDNPERQADVIKAYDLAKLLADHQTAALRLFIRAKLVDEAMKCLSELCKQPRHPSPDHAYDAIVEAIETAEQNKKMPEVARALSQLPAQSNLLPKAADLQANILLWRVGDFKLAAETLQKLSANDSRNVKRLQMQACLLNGQIEDAKKLLKSIPDDPEQAKKTALSGAYARSVEYYIKSRELESAEESWEDWQRRFPDSFWEGYSMVLKVRILESDYPQIAAKAAEAFALAVPDSAYAPELLDRASKLLLAADPEKSKSLRRMLKEKYPEDPLSQK